MGTLRDSRRVPTPSTVLLGVIVAFAAALIAVPLLDLAGIYDIISLEERPYKLQVAAQIASAIGSVILTLGLVVLYWEQTKTQQQQETWMAAEHTPNIIVDEWTPNGNKIEFDIANLGEGVARDLTVVIELSPIVENEVPLTVENPESTLTREDVNSHAIQAEQIDPITFVGFPRGSVSSSENQTVGSILADLAQHIDSIEYTIRIEFDFVKRDSGTASVHGGRTDLTEDMDLEALILTRHDETETELNLPPEIE